MDYNRSSTNYENLYTRYKDDSAVLKTESYAHWTIPSVFADPELRDGKRVSVRKDYQSVGALYVNSLSAKLARLLFPSNQPFFRIDSTGSMAQLAEAMGAQEADLASGLSELENTAYRRVFLKSSYHQLVHAMKLLIITGNVLLYRDSDSGNMNAFSIRQYALTRDGGGKVLDIVLKERTVIQELPLEVRHLFRGRKADDAIYIYTRIQRQKREATDVFVVTQQLEGGIMLDNRAVYPEAICPYIPAVWNLVTGENYGRGLVEDYAGDLAKLSALSEALSLYEIESCRVLHLAKPGSQIDVDSMASEESGAWVAGDPGQVSAYEAGDYNKIQALAAEVANIGGRLAPAFMYSQNQRDAERVTAEEIRQNAEEAESSLGGVYSVIADTLHIPMAHILCWEVNPKFVGEVVKRGLTLSVLTGVAALSRSADVTALLQAAQALGVILPVIQANPRIDPDKVTDMVLQGFGLNTKELYRTEEQLKALQAQQQPLSPNAADPSLAGVSTAIDQAGLA